MRKLEALSFDVEEHGKPKLRIIPLSHDAAELFDSWWRSLPEREGTNARMNGWWGKSQGAALRLALVLEYLNWAVSNEQREPNEVSAETMEKVIRFMDLYVGPMAEIAHGVAGSTEVDPITLMLAQHIREKGLMEFTVRELHRSGPMRNCAAEEIKAACFDLVGYGWLQAAPIRQGDTPGKSQGRFLVNPII